MKMNARVGLIIREFTESPNLVTSRIGLLPTETWLKGDHIGQSILTRPSNGWSLWLSGSEEEDIGEILERLIIQIEAGKSSIMEMHEVTKEVSCVIELLSEGLPGLHLNERTMKEIADLGASVDIDIYDFR